MGAENIQQSFSAGWTARNCCHCCCGGFPFQNDG